MVELPSAISSPATRTATSAGMAKPMPMLPDWLPSEPEPVPGDRGVDPDHRAVQVDQRAAGVARVDGRVGLHREVDGVVVAAGPDRPGGVRHDPAGHRLRQAQRCARREHGLTNLDRVRLRELDRHEVGHVVDLDHGQVVGLRTADDRGLGRGPVVEGHRDRRRSAQRPPTTWLLVRMWPSWSSTMPLPMSPLRPDCTVIVTTESSISSAAAAMLPSGAGLWGAEAVVTRDRGGRRGGLVQIGVRTDPGPRPDHGRQGGGREDRRPAADAAWSPTGAGVEQRRHARRGREVGCRVSVGPGAVGIAAEGRGVQACVGVRSCIDGAPEVLCVACQTLGELAGSPAAQPPARQEGELGANGLLRRRPHGPVHVGIDASHHLSRGPRSGRERRAHLLQPLQPVPAVARQQGPRVAARPARDRAGSRPRPDSGPGSPSRSSESR